MAIKAEIKAIVPRMLGTHFKCSGISRPSVVRVAWFGSSNLLGEWAIWALWAQETLVHFLSCVFSERLSLSANGEIGHGSRTT